MSRVFSTPFYEGDVKFSLGMCIKYEQIRRGIIEGQPLEKLIDGLFGKEAISCENAMSKFKRLKLQMSRFSESQLINTAYAAFVIADLMEENGAEDLVIEDAASYWVVSEVFDKNLTANLGKQHIGMVLTAKRTTILAAFLSNLNPSVPTFDKALEEYHTSDGSVTLLKRSLCYLNASRVLQYSSWVKGGREKYNTMVRTACNEKEISFESEWFLHKEGSPLRSIFNSPVYTISGYIVIVCSRSVVILDSVRREPVIKCIQSIGLTFLHASLCEDAIDRELLCNLVGETMKGVRVAMGHGEKAIAALSKYIRSLYVYQLALVLPETATLEEKNVMLKQSKHLLDESEEYNFGFEGIKKVFLSSDPERIVSLGTVWHLCPPTGAHLDSVFSTLEKYGLKGKQEIGEVWEKTIELGRRYVSAHIIAAYPRKMKKRKEFRPYMNEPWVRSCLKGDVVLPTKEEFSRIPSNAFSILNFTDYTTLENFSASDVTYIDCGAKDEERMVVLGIKRRNTKIGSEIQHYLARPFELSTHISVGDPLIYEKANNHVTEVSLAAKSENAKGTWKKSQLSSRIQTKPHRETYSACSLTRSVLSSLDKNFELIANAIPGVTTRKTTEEVDKSLALMGKIGMVGTEYFTVSADVSAWSLSLNRRVVAEWINVLLSFFSNPPNFNPLKLIDPLIVFTSRAKGYRAMETSSGTCQGFTGCADSILHIILAFSIVSDILEKYAVSPVSSMFIMTLIDDIVISIRNADVPLQDIISGITKGYEKHGLECDFSKSLYRRSVFSFLNRIYTCFGEIPTNVKVFGKAGRSENYEFLTLRQTAEALFSTFKGAIGRGLTPLKGYYVACLLTTLESEWVAKQHMLSCVSVPVAYLLPSTYGGLGIPTIGRWVTTDCALYEASIFSASYNSIILEKTIRSVTIGGISTTKLRKDLLLYNHILETSTFEPLTASTFLRSPCTFKVVGVKAPFKAETVVADIIIGKRWVHPFWKDQLNDRLCDDQYSAVITALRGETVPHAALIMISDAMIDKLTVHIRSKIGNCKAFMKAVGKAHKGFILKKITEENRSIFENKILAHAAVGFLGHNVGNVRRSGCEVLAKKIADSISDIGFSVVDTVIPPPSDYLMPTSWDHGGVVVTSVPGYCNFASLRSSSENVHAQIESVLSKPAKYEIDFLLPPGGPVREFLTSVMDAFAMINTIGKPYSVLKAIISAPIVGFGKTIVMTSEFNTDKLQRMCMSTKRLSHTIAAELPFISKMTVNNSTLYERLSGRGSIVDFELVKPYMKMMYCVLAAGKEVKPRVDHYCIRPTNLMMSRDIGRWAERTSSEGWDAYLKCSSYANGISQIKGVLPQAEYSKVADSFHATFRSLPEIKEEELGELQSHTSQHYSVSGDEWGVILELLADSDVITTSTREWSKNDLLEVTIARVESSDRPLRTSSKLLTPFPTRFFIRCLDAIDKVCSDLESKATNPTVLEASIAVNTRIALANHLVVKPAGTLELLSSLLSSGMAGEDLLRAIGKLHNREELVEKIGESLPTGSADKYWQLVQTATKTTLNRSRREYVYRPVLTLLLFYFTICRRNKYIYGAPLHFLEVCREQDVDTYEQEDETDEFCLVLDEKMKIGVADSGCSTGEGINELTDDVENDEVIFNQHWEAYNEEYNLGCTRTELLAFHYDDVVDFGVRFEKEVSSEGMMSAMITERYIIHRS